MRKNFPTYTKKHTIQNLSNLNLFHILYTLSTFPPISKYPTWTIGEVVHICYARFPPRRAWEPPQPRKKGPRIFIKEHHVGMTSAVLHTPIYPGFSSFWLCVFTCIVQWAVLLFAESGHPSVLPLFCVFLVRIGNAFRIRYFRVDDFIFNTLRFDTWWNVYFAFRWLLCEILRSISVSISQYLAYKVTETLYNIIFNFPVV